MSGIGFIEMLYLWENSNFSNKMSTQGKYIKATPDMAEAVIDCDNWKENAIKHQRELDEVDAKAEYIIKTVNGYKDAHDQLIYELTNNIKIKKKYNRNLIICWSFSGTLILINVLLVVTFICLFLFGKISL